jgi:hypothetical protein
MDRPIASVGSPSFEKGPLFGVGVDPVL